MDFQELHDRLVAKGYNDDTADAKIAHDVVLKAIDAADLDFKIVADASSVSLQINPTEQVFVEKLKSLLRIGPASTRFKDVYDMYYLRTRVRKGILRKMIQAHIYEDDKLREKDSAGIIFRLERIFRDKGFLKGLHAPASSWLDVPAEEATKVVVDFLAKL